ALDAAGARLPLAIDAVDGSVRLTVPAAFVADCHLPLVVDPLIRTETLQPTAFHEDAPSLAWCGQAQTWFAVWQRHYSATDLDVFAQRLDHTMTPVGTRTSIDMTLDSWERPKVASTHTPPRFLTVAQVVPAGNAGPSWIGGRLFRTDTGSFDPVLVIDREGVAGHHPGNKTTPDVGGDTNGLSPSHFTVVFCREAGPDNRDVLLRQVTADGALRTASALVLDDTRADEHSPAISHGNGWWVNDRQRWAVVWIRRAVHHGVPDGDVRAAIITTDGQPDPLAGGAPFTLDETAADDDAPSVSSLMEGDRVKFLFLCTVTRKVGGGDRDVFGILFDGHGAVRSTQNLSQIDGSPAGIVQGDASVDTDGARFVVTYTEHVGHTRSFLSLLAWQPHDDQLLLQQGRVQLASGYQRDARVCARSSSGAGHPHYGVAYTVLPGSGNRHVALALFDGVLPGGFSIRPTGCAGLEVTPASTPAIGHSIAFNLNRGGVVGMLLGLPAHVPLPCASCALGVADPLLLPGTTLPIPPFPNLVGAVVAVQCFHVGTGTCFGNLALSNTVDVTIQ
ncbi:MAG TPA: hypothetical protein VK081_15150, partial [Planctomycetota bacterium]|nr:hypothetical protein [Planctomycetota bacterium]